MKHLLLILIMASIGFSSMGQKVITRGGGVNQGGGAGDTITASASKYYSVAVKVLDKLDYSVQVETDSISGTPGYTALLQGSNNYSDWENVDTVTTTSGVDTAFYFTNSGNLWKYVRISLTGSATAQKSKAEVNWNFLK